MTEKYRTTTVSFSKETLRQILELQELWGESRSRTISRCVQQMNERYFDIIEQEESSDV